jgi:hypothetical protein
MHTHLGVLGVTGFLMRDTSANPLDYVEGGSLGSNVAEKVRRYYSDRVLKEYEVGLVEEIDAILATLVKDLRDDGLDLDAESARDPRSEAGRIKVFKRLDRFEPKFFERMAEAKERADRRHGSS